MHPHIHVYGGFSGNEMDRAQRNWEEHKTIIDGEKKRRCVLGADSSTLDGFTIQRGHTNYDGEKYRIVQPLFCGGAILNVSASPLLQNCVFIDNVALEGGGGMANFNAAPQIKDCLFSGNTSNKNGGGIYSLNSSPVLSNCTFDKNLSKDSGGALSNERDSFHFDPSLVIISDCTFTANRAKRNGGGIYTTHNAAPKISGCRFLNNSAGLHGGGVVRGRIVTHSVFLGNEAGEDGGGLFLGKATDCTFRGNIAKRNGGGICSGIATNCVFVDNTAQVDGGGMCWSGAVNSTFFGNTAQGNGSGVYDRYSVFLTNCIVWGNSAEKEGQAIYPVHAEAPRVTYSCIEGGYAGEGNIDTPPLFVNPGDGDVSLQADSPCIDVGTSTKDAPTTDIEGAPRPQGNGVDMGAYEWNRGDASLR